jgi:hypothetical protein
MDRRGAVVPRAVQVRAAVHGQRCHRRRRVPCPGRFSSVIS